MEIAIAVAAKIAEYTVRPVGQWLCYSCHYKSNMENLKELEKTLRDAKNRIRHDVDAASNNGDEIEDDVKTWLTKVDGIIHQLATKKLGGGEEEAESRNSNASCLNLKQRHRISREAKEMVDNIAELLKKANFPRVSYRPPASQEMVTPRNVDYMTLDSRILITKRIMEVLRDANVNKIGVWGLPGVGKSTLMNEIFRKAKEESLLDEVAMANVTDNPNLSRIQSEIADMLGLKLDPNKTEIGRKAALRERLEKDKEKRILVILDDIWKQIDLEKIGITPSERCKVLLTSRDLHVLSSEMDTELENSFKLDTLGEEEAWNLFEKMAGNTVKDDRDLRNEAIKVAKACGGLPIALVTVSRSLKNEKNLGIWKDALVQLTRPTPDTKIWSSVYSCIRLSYERLDGRQLKSLFLLCARQGYNISYGDLLRYGFGLCLFHGIDTLEEARNRLETLVRDLQDACLLLQSPHSSDEFYMHDLVRHVATIIASNDHNMFVMRGDGGQKAWPDVDALKRCEALSIHGGDHIHKYPNKIECPKLRYFHVQCDDYGDEDQYLEIPNIFFQGMEKLEVLSLTNIQLSSLLPLTNLQTLCLDGCKLGDIHWIGELKTLVILSLARSDISNLPREIESLTALRLLDLTGCSKLRVIPPKVLSSLVNLEELYMRGIYNVQWEVEGPNNEGKNASLAELKKLSHLITLEIDIKDAENLPKDLFSEKLERYKICIGDIWDSYFTLAAFSRMLKLQLNMSSFQLDFGIKILLKRTEYLYLDESYGTKSVFYELDREDFQQLKYLHIENSWHLPELTSFENLKVLKVGNCEKLRFIFSSSIARGLSLLEELKITRCNNVGAIFVKEDQEDHGIEEVFRRLETLVLMDLPKLVSFFSTRETNSEGNDHDLQLPLLHHQLSFPNLKNLHLLRLPKIKNVWSNVNGCESLKSLVIRDCWVMEDIIARNDGTDPTTRLLFPSLTLLRLIGLPKLKWFFQGVRTLESSSSKELHELGGTLFGIEEVAFPNLTKLHLLDLPKIKHVWSKDLQTILRFQNLQEISVEGCASLKSLFPASIGTCLKQLKEIRITASGILEEIVGAEEGEAMGRMLVFEFPQVTSLVLSNLPRLECFYKGVHISKWPLLKNMIIWKCEKLEVFVSGLVSEEIVEERQSQMSIKQPLFLVDEISFPSLELLRIARMEKLVVIWYGQVAASPTKLDISYCGSLEAVFEQHEGQNGKESHALTVTQRLREVHLSYLPKLRNIWNIKDSHQRNMYSFPNLLDIEVGHCESLKSLFPTSVGGCLKQLKKIKIDDCGVEEIVGAEGGEAMGRTVFVFPQVTSLVLKNLRRLECFYKGVHISKWPMLKTMSIKGCKKVEIFASGLVSFEETVEKRQYSQMSIKQPLFLVDEISFPRLELLRIARMEKLGVIWYGQVAASPTELDISYCGSLEAVFKQHEGLNGKESHALTATQRLREMYLESLPKLRNIWNIKDSHQRHMYSFPNLLSINVYRCESLKSLFPASIGGCLKQLKEIKIDDCGVEEIVGAEGGEAMGRTLVFEFPQLTSLHLAKLPRLECFYRGVHISKWPMLEIMLIRECEKVEVFASGLMSFEETVEERQYSHMSIKQPLFLVDELSFSSLKKLVILNMDKLEIIWQGQVAVSSFLKNTQDMEIRQCEKLLHVFQSNFRTTTILTQSLTRLCIWDCSSLETIFRNMEGHNGKEPQVLIAPSSETEESVAREDGTARHIEFPILTQNSSGFWKGCILFWNVLHWKNYDCRNVNK